MNQLICLMVVLLGVIRRGHKTECLRAPHQPVRNLLYFAKYCFLLYACDSFTVTSQNVSCENVIQAFEKGGNIIVSHFNKSLYFSFVAY